MIEQASWEKETLFTHAFDYAPIGMAIVGLDGQWLKVNRSLSKIVGYAAYELVNMTFQSITYPDDLNLDMAQASQLLKGEIDTYQMEKRYIHKNGQIVWVRLSGSLVRNKDHEPLYFIAQVENITGKKETESRLQESQKLYELIANNAQDLICYALPGGIIQYVSPSVKTILGYEPEECTSEKAISYFHPEDVLQLHEGHLLPGLKDSDEDIFHCRVLHKQGYYVWFETTVKKIRNREGEVTKILGVGRDISKRKKIEEALQNSEEKYRQLVEGLPIALVIGKKERWVYVNDTAAKLLGAKNKEEIINKNLFQFVHSDYHERAVQSMLTTEENGEPFEWSEVKLIRIDGQTLEVEVMALPTVYEKEPARYVIFTDISDRKKTQERLQYSEKLSAAGQLAAGIAHEIRNPLTAIKGFLHLIQSGYGEKKEYYDIISSEFGRIELILNELLLLAKPTSTSFEAKDVREIIAHVTTLLNTQAIMRNIQILTKMGNNPLYVKCDENQLKQVFINFLKNAIEAMECGGDIVIEAKRDKGAVQISLTDQGRGIPQDELKRLGEPFYTTKENGTGLGLMISYQIVGNHGGSIRITSELSKGSKVEIRLPLNES